VVPRRPLAPVEHDSSIGVADRAEAVGDEDDGESSGQPSQRLLSQRRNVRTVGDLIGFVQTQQLPRPLIDAYEGQHLSVRYPTHDRRGRRLIFSFWRSSSFAELRRW
jgi:hypothetical protein